MSSEELVQYALQLQGQQSSCDPCFPGNPCINEGTCFPTHETGFLPGTGPAGGRLRALQAATCESTEVTSRTAEINEQCCGEDDKECEGGTPTSCDAGCAAVFLPFWADCASQFQFLGMGDLSSVVRMCQAQVPEPEPEPEPERRFTCDCPTGWRGDLCDQPTGCEGLPCGEHGTCTANGGTHTCSCATGWSGPSCEVQQCSLPYHTVSDAWRSTKHESGDKGDRQIGDPTCPSEYSSLNHGPTGVGGGDWYQFTGAAGDALPLQPISNYDPTHGLFAKDGKGSHCGYGAGGWLSGWSGANCTVDGDCPLKNPSFPDVGHLSCDAGRCGPPWKYSTAGHYPSVADGVVQRTVCFDESSPGYPNQCHSYVAVEVVRCDAGFLLWRLPYAPSCSRGYCTATDLSAGRATGCDSPGEFPGSGSSPCGEHSTCIADGSSHTCKPQCESECKGSCGCLRGMCDFTSDNCVGGCFAYDSSC